jgi:glycosyltransferase involved in cell wall biosynthesis
MARGEAMKLTIAIPTYDRPVPLSRTLEVLLPQLTNEVNLIVVDNASPDVSGVPLLNDPRVHWVRNPANIGANANILRCLELASSEWIWMLGDDDNPRPDSVQMVLEAIRQAGSALSINFDSAHGGRGQNFTVRGREELIERIPAFGNLLFVSTNLYRVEPMREHLHMGYRFAYSMAPHVALLILSAGKDGEIVFRPETLVDTDTVIDGNHWSAINQSLSIPTLLELPLSPRERMLLANQFQLPDLANLLIQLLGTGVRRGEFESSKYYYSQIAWRLWPFTPFTKRVAITLGRIAFVVPKISLKLVDAVLKKQKGSSVMARLRAETFDPRI